MSGHTILGAQVLCVFLAGLTLMLGREKLWSMTWGALSLPTSSSKDSESRG